MSDVLVDRYGNPLQSTSDRAFLTPDPSSFLMGNAQTWLGSAPSMSASRPSIKNAATTMDLGQSHSVISSAVGARADIVSELVFIYRHTGPRGKLFRNRGLARLDLLTPFQKMQMEQDASYCGNAYFWWNDQAQQWKRLRPDWMYLVLASNAEPAEVELAAQDPYNAREALEDTLDAQVVAYIYKPPHEHQMEVIEAGPDLIHFKPEPHPLSYWLGGSWVTSIIREAVGDLQADTYVDKYFEQGASPRLIFKVGKGMTKDQAEEWAEVNEAVLQGAGQSFRNAYIAHGTDVERIGTSLGDLDMKAFRGGFETRIAMRSKVHPVILGSAEGMQGSSLNAGNYSQIRRLWADKWFTPYARLICSFFAPAAPELEDAELWWDRTQIMLLQQDEKEAAEEVQIKAATASSLILQGFEPQAALRAVGLDPIEHTGRLSVQLHPMSEDSTGLTEEEANDDDPVAGPEDGGPDGNE